MASQTQSKKKFNTVKLADFDPKYLDYGECKETKFSQMSNMTMVNYNINKNFHSVLLPSIHLTNYGIPQFHAKWANTDEKRQIVRVPLERNPALPVDETDVKNKALLLLKLKELDAYMQTDAVKTKLFGSKKDKYGYSPLIVVPGDPIDDSKKDTFRCLSVKFSLDVDFKTKEIKTAIFTRTLDTDGNKTAPELQEALTIDDVCKHVPFGSNVRLSIMPSKIYSLKSANQFTKKIQYGLKFKVKQIEVTKRNTQKMDNKDNQFSDDEDSQTKSSKKVEELVVEEDVDEEPQTMPSEVSESEEDLGEEVSEEVVEEKPKKKTSVKNKKTKSTKKK